MKRLMMAVAFAMLVPTVASAQAAPTSLLVWDQPQVASAAEAQAFTFTFYADGATTGTVLTGVTCTGAAPVVCSVAFPAFTPGSHSLTISATNAAGEGPKSAPFAFTFVVVPAAPLNVRIG